MRILLDSIGNQIRNGAVYDMGELSANMHHTLSFYLVTDTPNPEPVSVSTSLGRILASYTEEGNPAFIGDAHQHSVQFEQVPETSYWVASIHIIYNNSLEQDTQDNIAIGNINIQSIQHFKIQEPRLQVLLNNMGFVMDESWNYGFLSTDMDDTVDNVKLNQKRRELLLDFLTLTQLKGSYKSLNEGIEFMEFGGRITIYEYWYDTKNDKYILVSREQSKSVNQDLYKKTKYLSLHYSINVQNPDDPIGDDGIPNMVEEFVWDRDMFVKLCTLKNILQQYFLPDDILIVDIAGEHISFGEHTVKYWPTQVNIFNNDEHAKFDGIEIEKYNPDGDDELCPIFAHTMLIDLGVYGITQDTEHPLVFKNGSAHNEQPLYRIISLDPADSNKDYEFATCLWSGDCAVVGVIVKSLAEDRPYTYAYALEQLNAGAWERVYLRDGFTKDTLDKDCKFAIRTAGTYRVVFYAFDEYGSMNYWDFTFYCDFPTFVPKVKLLSPKYMSEKQKVFSVRNLIFTQPYEINTLGYEFGARDLANEKYDVNDLSSEVNNIIRKYIAPKDDTLSSFNLSQLRNIELSRLKDVPLSEYSDGYEVLLFTTDSIPQQGTFSLQIFQSDEENVIEYSSYIDLLTKLSQFDENENMAKWYSVDLQFVQMRDKNDELGPIQPMLIFFAKERGVAFDEFRLIINDQEVEPFYSYTTIQYFSKGPSIRLFDQGNLVIKPATGTLHILYGLRDVVIDNLTINTCEDLFNAIKDLPDLIVTHANESVALSSLQYDLRISHPAFGERYEPYRKSPIELLYDASDSKLIEPGTYIFAICDIDWKLDNYTIHWTIYDSLTGQQVYDWTGYMLKWASLEAGVFDVELSVEDKRTQEVLVNRQIGCITIQ